MDISDAFTSAHVKKSLEAVEGVEQVLVSESVGDDSSVFEVYPVGDELSDEVEGVIEAEFRSYGPKVTREETTDGRVYVRVEVSGLIQNTN